MIPLTTRVPLDFGFGFAYGGIPGQRPEVRVRFAAVDEHGRFLAETGGVQCLVDSGADETMLNADIAPKLGLDLGTMPEVPVHGVGGITLARRHHLLAELCGGWLVVPVLFEPGRSVNLLGRAGAFEGLRLVFLHGHTIVLADAHPT